MRLLRVNFRAEFPVFDLAAVEATRPDGSMKLLNTMETSIHVCLIIIHQ